MKYEDFVLQIVSGGGGYTVLAQSPRGDGRGSFVPPFPPGKPDALQAALCEAVRGRQGTREVDEGRGNESPARLPEEIGERLFEALFPGEILRLYERSVDLLEGRAETGLRLKLRLDPNDPELAPLLAFPWELLRQPGTPEFLALSRFRPIVRYLTIPRPVRAAKRPERLRVLVVAASPQDDSLSPLSLERELHNLRSALAPLEGVEIVEPPTPTLDGIRRALLEQECHVLHFMGHGGFFPRKDTGVLYFETADGAPDRVRGTGLVNTLMDFPALRLVVLNACDSARTARRGFHPFASVAGSLVMGGLPAVVAMQCPISDEAAIAFSQTFYQRIAAGDPIDTAVAEGRQAIHAKDAGGFAWATPVLFMRTPNGELFPAEDILPEGWWWRRMVRPAAAVLVALLLMAGLWLGYRHWRVDDLNEKGAALFQHRRFADARETFLAALALDPRAAQVHSNLAAAEEKLGMYDSAEEHYVEAVRLQPDSARYLYDLGYFLNGQKRYEKAYEALSEAVKKKEEDPDRKVSAYNELARAALHIKHLSKAREALEEALRIEIDGEAAPVYRQLGQVALLEGKPREAIGFLNQALNRSPRGERGRLETLALLAAAHDKLDNVQEVCRAADEFRVLDAAGINPEREDVDRIATQRNCPSPL